MTEYINKEFYKQIPANERHFIKLSQEAAYAAVKELEAANIPHSATISEYRSIVTVNTADKERAEKIAENSAKAFPNVRTVLGNTEFKYIRDKKYIDTDADTARKIADILSGNASNRFSGIIRGEKATITVSGEKNAAAVRAMVDNLKNMDLLQALRERGFERIADTNGFVNIRSVETGEVCGFNGMAAVRDMFDNPENEFFYPLSYRIAYREHPTNGDYYYCILKYSPADKSTAKVYRDENNKPPIFKSVDEALSYANSNAVEITNIDEEIANWRELDREREDNSIIEENRKLIENFPISGGNYVDLVSYNPNNDTFSWTYYNPDGDNGNGAFIDKTVTKDDIFAAYSERIAAANEEQGRNAFIAYLNEHCKENVIELHSGYFYDYADDYINYASRNFAYYFGISENSKAAMSVDSFINDFELNCSDVKIDKQRREQAQKISASSFRVELDGYSGAWNVIDNAEIDGRELFMLENDYYGDSVAYIVADKDGNVIDDNVWGDFEEYENTLVKRGLIENAESSEGGITMPVLQVFADDMKRYGFEVNEDNGVFTVNKKDIASYVRMDTIAEILYDISEKYRFEPNEVGNNHLLDLNRFYDSYEWDGYDIGKNVLENTVIALQSGNFEPVENYVEQVNSVCENSDGSMQYEKSRIAEVAENLDKIKAAFAEKTKTELETRSEVPNGDLSDEGKTAEIPQEGNIHFGYFGNGVLCYDISKIDKEIDDYLSVAHISSEGNIRYYVDDLSESDKKHIENHAKGVKERFTAYWNSLSLQTRYGMLYDKLLDTANLEQIRAFEADHSVTDMSEKVKKYEHSLIFRDGEFPSDNSAKENIEELSVKDDKENNPIRTSAYGDEMQTQASNDNFEIYQVKSGDEYFFKRFIDLSSLGGSPDMSDYDLVYSGKLSEISVTAENKDDILENIYTKFNNNRPDDFTGHSLSVSDIVVLHTDGTDTAHYVDDVGFKEVSEFLTEKSANKSAPENFETKINNLVAEKNREAVNKINVGYDISLNHDLYTVKAIDGDFSLTIEPVDKNNADVSAKQYVGNWKEKLLEEAGNNPLFVYSDKLVKELKAISDKTLNQNGKVQKSKRTSNTIPHRNFKKMKKLFPEFMEKSHTYEHYESNGYEPLSAEWITDNTMSLMHTYVQNGDLMRDPDVVFKVDFEKETVNAVSYENSGVGIYREYGDGSKGQKDTNSFVVSWLNNIEQQSFELTRYEDINGNSVDLTHTSENSHEAVSEEYPKEKPILSENKAYIFSEIKFETGEVYIVPDTVTDDNIAETAAYKEIFERYADRDNIENLDDMLRVNIRHYRFGSGENTVPNETETEYIRSNSIDVINNSEEIGNTEFFAHFWKNVDDILNDLDSKAAELHKSSPHIGDRYEEKTYIFPSDYNSDYPDNYSAVSKLKINGEWYDTEEAVKNMNARDNTDTAQIEGLQVRTISFDGIIRSEEMSPEAFHIILDRTNNNRDKLKEAAELNAKGDIMPFYTKTSAEATAAGERELYFSDKRENERCAASLDYSVSCNNDGMHFDSDKAISDLLNAYSLDRVALIIAARVSDAGKWDSRFSRENVEWAENTLNAFPAEKVTEITRLGLNSHSVLLNAAADELRKNYEMFRNMQTSKETDISEEQSVIEPENTTVEHTVFDTDNDLPIHDRELPELQKKTLEIAKKYEKLSMQDKINIIAQSFGGTTGKIVTSPCSGKWRGTSDISIEFDNGKSIYVGNRITPKAKTVKVHKECVNAAFSEFNPEIIKITKELALPALREQEKIDGKIAVERGLKPYTLLNVEFNDGKADNNSYIGWYYVTLAVNGKIHAHMDTGLYHEISYGKERAEEPNKNYRAAGALKDADVDYVFRNVGFSTKSGLYTLPISDDVRERAERTLKQLSAENIAAEEKSPMGTKSEVQNLSGETKENSSVPEMREERSNKPQNSISAEDIDVGDKFLYKGNEVTVSSLYGINPDDISIFKHTVSNGMAFNIPEFVNKYDLAENGVYLGNPENENERTEETAVYTDEPVPQRENQPAAEYKPRINDVIENEDGVYRITDISSSFVTMLEADTLLPEEKLVPLSDFHKGNYSVIERGEIIPEETETAEMTTDSEEIPAPKTENFSIKNDSFGDMGGAKTRYAANIEAIRLLKEIEAEGRTATAEEQSVLAKYTGWGAIPQAFDSANDKWSGEYAELKEILTPEEYEAARHSTMNAHYTSPTVISAMYSVLDNLGFEKGNILEPAMGTGNFFGMLPEIYKDSKLYGVELDSITGRIAQQLYPNANIQIKGYEKTAFPDNSFDVAIGNVPFGDYKVNDKRYNDSNFNIHDYFFAKTLDKVHAGGIVAFVTSKGTMDKENDDIRRYIAERAELLGAIRLPNNAFKATAGTEVTSDILILQKREKPVEINPDSVEWLKKSKTADGLSVNNYFVQHPEMVLGKITEGNKMYGNNSNDTSCIPIEGTDLKQQLAEAIKNIKGSYKAAEKRIEPQNAEIIPAPENSRTFSFYAQNGNIYYRKDEDTMEKVNISKDVFDRAMGMIEIRDNVHKLLNLQLENSGGRLDSNVAASRAELNRCYDEFVKKYGNISNAKNAKAFKDDNGYNLLTALEVKDEKGKVTGKADIFTKNTLKPKIIAAHVETAEEALILSISEKGKVDFELMTELCGMDKDRLIAELDGRIYKLPQETEKYVTADEYLSGNIRKKIKDIEHCPDPKAYEKNYEALQAAMPPRVEAKDISVKLGSHWVDPKYIRQFILEKFQPDARTNAELNVSYSSVAGTWKIEGQTATAKNNHTATSRYGTYRKNAYEIIEGILNNSDLQVKDRKKDEFGFDMKDKNGKYILIPNENETKAVRHCANVIKSEFVDWIFKDPERREALVQKYNEVYNSFRYREYDGSHLNFVGMNTDITLKEHQKNAIARGLFGGNTLLAHAVGAGKSATRS